MSGLKTLAILMSIFAPILEMFFALSNQDFLINFRIIYIAAIFFILNKNFRLSLILIVFGSVLVELLVAQSIVGVSAMAFFLAILFVQFLGRVASFFNEENEFLWAGIILIASILIRHGLGLVSGFDWDFNIPALMLNLFVFMILFLIYQRSKSPQNAFKRK